MKYLLEKIRENTEEIIENLGYDLVDLEYIREEGSNFLRFYIGKRGGVSIDDCQNVSEVVSDILDEIDPINESYYLEVSSPGLDRPLKTDKDLERNIDTDVELSFYKAVDGAKKQIGKLNGYDSDSIILLQNNELVKYNRDDISTVKIYISF